MSMVISAAPFFFRNVLLRKPQLTFLKSTYNTPVPKKALRYCHSPLMMNIARIPMKPTARSFFAFSLLQSGLLGAMFSFGYGF